MNIYTVAKASQGLADYVNACAGKSIAVSYDSRIQSDVFAQVASGVFAANGIHAFIYPQIMPTPCLSFAVRYLSCSAGIMITASHNPAKYNGYKVYGSDGCQITDEAAEQILSKIEKLDIFDDVKKMSFEDGMKAGLIEWIPVEVYDSYIDAVKKQSLIGNEVADHNVSIVYTPLNGTGLKPVMRSLHESGFINVTVVDEQEKPDGNFPTCPYPNPEIRKAMMLGIQYAQKCHADLLLATDPDCDRVGIAFKDKVGEYKLLSGNEVGLLLLDYICARRTALNTMPQDPVMIKTIVTIDLAERIAEHYGVRTINVLTGFKYIGEQIGLLEAKGQADSYIFGFEESYGYLSGSYVRDKDGVNGILLVCEMFAYYKMHGISLLDKLDEIYEVYDYCLNTLHSYTFEGAAGFEKMQRILESLRRNIDSIGGKDVIKRFDYQDGLDGLPKSNVLKFMLKDNCSVVIRPSGTEPKLKMYTSVSAESNKAAVAVEKIIADWAEAQFA